MQFSPSYRNNNQKPNQIPTNSTPIMTFSQSYRNFKTRDDIEKQQIAASQKATTINQIIKEDRPKTMKWGQPTWFFLHTMAQKVKEDKFLQIRKEFLDMIFKICNNLPCPDCANHATRFMQGVNFDTITTKQHLKDLLFRFHNTVNARKGFAQFDYKELDAKYSSAITINIIQSFMQHFENKGYSARVSAHNFHRGMAIVQLKNWLSANIQAFDH